MPATWNDTDLLVVDELTQALPTIVIDAHVAEITVHLSGDQPRVRAEIEVPDGADPEAITSRSDGRTVTIKVPLRTGPADDESIGARILRAARFSFTRKATITVYGPEGASLDITTTGGDVTVEGVPAAARLATGGGDIALRDAGSAAVIERLEAKTGGGDIVASAALSARLKSGGGDIDLARAHDAEVKTGGGDVTIGTADGDVSVTTGGGDITIGRVSSGELSVRSGGGDVQIGVAAGVPVWQDVTTGYGDVRSDIDPVGAPADGQPYITLRATTGSGDITARTVH